MKCRTAIFSALALVSASHAAHADTTEFRMTVIKWAGINCGKLVSDKDFQAALDYADQIGPEKAANALRGVRYYLDTDEGREAACKRAKETLGL